MRGSAGGLRKIVRGGERAGEKTLGLYCRYLREERSFLKNYVELLCLKVERSFF